MQKGLRNAPTVYNAVYNIAQFWDGRAKDDPTCKARVEAYEDGDQEAPGNPNLPPTNN